jgi:hypothetical protein
VLPDLRINAPRLEPDPVLLEQLSQLSSASAPRGATGPTARSLMSAATVVIVAGLSWVTGTLPGVASPFDRHPAHQPTHEQAPLTPSGELPGSGEVVPPGLGVVPPAQAKPHQDNGNHTGQIKPHQNNGNHTGQIKPHQNNGNHTGQTEPHQNSGNHTGQTEPEDTTGNHTGQIKPADTIDQQGAQGGGQGGGQANGHRS